MSVKHWRRNIFPVCERVLYFYELIFYIRIVWKVYLLQRDHIEECILVILLNTCQRSYLILYKNDAKQEKQFLTYYFFFNNYKF